MFKNKIYNPQMQQCDVFFDKKYHSLIELTSYGHDIETAWLMDKTCSVLSKGAYQRKIKSLTDALAESVLTHAYDIHTHALYNEKGMVHAWKCPYHNGRMCLEMIQRLAG